MREQIVLTKDLKLFFLDILRSGEINTDQASRLLELIGYPQINVYIDNELISATLKRVREPISR